MLPPVDTKDSQQNAWVQDWLSAYMKEYPTDQDDYEKFESVMDGVQETYSYQDHEARKKADKDETPLAVSIKVLESIMNQVMDAHGDPEIVQNLNFAYAFLNATLQHTNAQV